MDYALFWYAVDNPVKTVNSSHFRESKTEI